MKKSENNQPLFIRILAAAFLIFWFVLRKNPDAIPGIWILVIFFVFFFSILGTIFISMLRQSAQKQDAELKVRAKEIQKQINQPAKNHFFSFLGMVLLGIYIFRNSSYVPKVVFIVHGIVTGFPLFLCIRALWHKHRGTVPGVPSSQSINNLENGLTALLSIAGLGFIGFICYLLVSHRIWFAIPFIIPFALIFGLPLYKAITQMIPKSTDKGESHLQQGKEQDPWDRPDIQR